MFKEKLIVVFLCCLLNFLSARSQYYYQDIYKTFQTNAHYQKDLKNRVQKVQILSFDAQQQPTPGFKCHKTFSPDEHKTTTFTQSFSTGEDYLTSFFDNDGRVIHTIDSSSGDISHTRIFYNEHGRIDSLVFISYAEKQPSRNLYLNLKPDTLKETHAYYYDSAQTLIKMIRLKKERPYMTIYFQTDSAGNVFKEFVKNSSRPIYYYKYKGGKLTDLFHYNSHQKKMIPDYLFDYNNSGLLAQKTIVLANTSNFIEWHFTYNDRGQIIRQEGYDKDNKKQTALVFKYTYRP